MKLKRMSDREYYWKFLKVLVQYGGKKEDVSDALLFVIAILSLIGAAWFMGWMSHCN